MRHSVDRILSNVNDYKICKECGMINWYERETCIYCKSSNFNDIGEGITDYINDGYYTDADILEV